jgi:hypothetical protein
MNHNQNASMSKELKVRISPEQLARLQEQFGSTTCHTFSEYIRDLLNRKPVSVLYRNQSLDEFLLMALALRGELLSIGRNFNRATLQLNKASTPAEWKDAIDFLAAEEFALREKMEEIKNLLAKTYDLWLQK